MADPDPRAAAGTPAEVPAEVPAETPAGSWARAREMPPEMPGDASAWAFGFSPRKLRFLRAFLPGPRIRRLRDPARLPAGATLYLWGMALPGGHRDAGRVIRVEDGFIRSAGLGAALARPLSWVFDDLGLHIDASRPSRLEVILSRIALTGPERAAADALVDSLIRSGVSKYNLTDSAGTETVLAENLPADRPVILVPGQVEDDASLRWGAPGICRNLDLLRAVRAARPDAFLIYKPHPDVVAGLRRRGAGEDLACGIADRVITAGDTVACLPMVDEVHVMTSLAGFEAILRGIPVTCWGQPFYAGWGLSTDMLPPPRRGRALSVAELAAGALIRYPRYLAPDGRPATAAEVVATLAAERSAGRQTGAGRPGQALLRAWLRLSGRV